MKPVELIVANSINETVSQAREAVAAFPDGVPTMQDLIDSDDYIDKALRKILLDVAIFGSSQTVRKALGAVGVTLTHQELRARISATNDQLRALEQS